MDGYVGMTHLLENWLTKIARIIFQTLIQLVENFFCFWQMYYGFGNEGAIIIIYIK